MGEARGHYTRHGLLMVILVYKTSQLLLPSYGTSFRPSVSAAQPGLSTVLVQSIHIWTFNCLLPY